jgi:hypothetical protein
MSLDPNVVYSVASGTGSFVKAAPIFAIGSWVNIVAKYNQGNSILFKLSTGRASAYGLSGTRGTIIFYDGYGNISFGTLYQWYNDIVSCNDVVTLGTVTIGSWHYIYAEALADYKIRLYFDGVLVRTVQLSDHIALLNSLGQTIGYETQLGGTLIAQSSNGNVVASYQNLKVWSSAPRNGLNFTPPTRT